MVEANKLSGLYIVLDGIVGCGKSKQTEELMKHLSLDFPNVEITYTKEPGGNKEADEIRQKLKYVKMTPEEEMFLFAESRRITLPAVVVPKLKEGGIVISDRSVTTSLAYQAYGRELGIEKVWEANKDAVNGVFPDVIIYMNVGREECLKRSAGENPDKFDEEDEKFWDRTIEGYEKLKDFMNKISPETNIIQIDDPKGEYSIEKKRLIIKEKLYPILEDYLHEGSIVRERQV